MSRAKCPIMALAHVYGLSSTYNALYIASRVRQCNWSSLYLLPSPLHCAFRESSRFLYMYDSEFSETLQPQYLSSCVKMGFFVNVSLKYISCLDFLLRSLLYLCRLFSVVHEHRMQEYLFLSEHNLRLLTRCKTHSWTVCKLLLL